MSGMCDRGLRSCAYSTLAAKHSVEVVCSSERQGTCFTADAWPAGGDVDA